MLVALLKSKVLVSRLYSLLNKLLIECVMVAVLGDWLLFAIGVVPECPVELSGVDAVVSLCFINSLCCSNIANITRKGFAPGVVGVAFISVPTQLANP